LGIEILRTFRARLADAGRLLVVERSIEPNTLSTWSGTPTEWKSRLSASCAPPLSVRGPGSSPWKVKIIRASSQNSYG
jgi:hypothetical protein